MNVFAKIAFVIFDFLPNFLTQHPLFLFTTMIYFLLAVAFTVALYLIMRSFPKYKVNSLHAVIFNYYTCVAMGLLLMPDRAQYTQAAWTSTPVLLTLALGIMFVVVFVLIGSTTTQVGVTTAALASNMSLVIPVVFGLFVFKNNNKDFTFFNYLGLLLALVALALSTLKKGETKTSSGGLLLFLPVLLFLASGTNNTLINYISATFYEPSQSALFTAIACTGAILIGTIFLIIKILTTNDQLTLRSIAGGLILGLPNFLSFYFLLKALSAFGNSAAFVFPIYNVSSMLVSSFLAWLFFKEKLQSLNKWGLLVAVIAILLISYQEILASF
jgi:drug/metabolite transporter (DMT)-like permease